MSTRDLLRGVFPLVLVPDRSRGLQLTLAHREDLELAVAALDDWHDDYRGHGADGVRRRLVVAAHTCLLVVPVDEGWHRGRLQIVQGRSDTGELVLAERSDGVVTRTLEFEPNGHRTPGPTWPNPLRPDAGLGFAPSPTTAREFDELWTCSTQARAHRRHRTGWWGRVAAQPRSGSQADRSAR